MKTIDLHTHSYYSDGTLSPADLMQAAKAAGLSAVALSDHDTTNGLDEAEAEARRIGLEFIPAVELSVISDTETHIVGLFIDRYEPTFQEALARSQQVRKERNRQTANALMALGFACPLEEAEALAGHGIVGRAHFAKLMVQKGYVSSVPEAFDRYLASGRPAYSGQHLFSDKQAIELIHRAHGVAILAHLHLIRLSDDALFSYLKRLKNCGLDGLEGYYTEYTDKMAATFRSFAQELGLILSGGSDFHGATKPQIAIGKGYGSLAVPYDLLQDLRSRAKQRS